MDKKAKPATLAIGVLAVSAMAAPAMAQDAVRTRPAMTTEQMIAAQQQQIEAQQAQIEALREQLQDVTATLSNRVDRVETQTEAGRVNFGGPGPRLEAPNSRNSLQFVGAVQATFGEVVGQDNDDDGDGALAANLNGGTEIKRARIGLQGTAFSDYNYAVEVELAQAGNVSAAARDLWVQYNGFRPFSFTIGNMKPLVGLETSFSDRSNAATFAESSVLSSLITAPGTRYIGLRATTGGNHWSAALGAYGDDVNNNNVTTPYEEGGGFAGRITLAPFATPTSLLHFGVSGYARQVATALVTSGAAPLGELGQLRVRAQPESTIDAARLIDTAYGGTATGNYNATNLNFAETVQLLGFETAGFHGPFGFQAEWAQMDIGQSDGRPDLTFTGAYVNANWFLTGESRVYDPRTGLFTRFSPRAPLDPQSGTWGAWEIAARWSRLDLNSEENTFSSPVRSLGNFVGSRGGEETNYTLGLNWYWNAYFRLMLNYVHADAERVGFNGATAATTAERRFDATADLISLRVQQEW